MYAEYTQLQLTFPRIITLGNPVFKAKYFFAKKLFSYLKVLIMRKSVKQEEWEKFKSFKIG